jgi:hypothetical protein
MSTQSAGQPRDWKRTRRMVRGIAILAATAYVGVVFGRFLAETIQDSNVKTVLGVPLAWGVAGLGLTYIITSIEKLFELALTLWEYVTKPDKESSLFPGCVALACLVAYLTALPTVFSGTRIEPAQAEVKKELVYLARMTGEEPRPAEAFPFLFGLASGPPGWSKGVNLSKEQEADLTRLLGSLKACVGSNPDENVEIQVQGFADENEFPSKTRELNREAANRRAANLHQRIVAITGAQDAKSKVIVKDPVQWASLEAMIRHPRYFKARPLRETGRGKDQGLFNRRADIMLLRAGACEKLAAR